MYESLVYNYRQLQEFSNVKTITQLINKRLNHPEKIGGYLLPNLPGGHQYRPADEAVGGARVDAEVVRDLLAARPLAVVEPVAHADRREFLIRTRMNNIELGSI